MNDKVTKLCSDVDTDVTRVVCDLPLGHKGPHKATVVWGDENVGEDR